MDSKKVKYGSRDVINSFPDEVLAKILSFLSTKRAASTTLVSKRWRNLFPLMFQLFASQHRFCLDASELVYPEEGKSERRDVQESFKDFTDKTLSSCTSIKKLTLKFPLICFPHTKTDQWLRRAEERGVVDIDLRFKMGSNLWQHIWRPSVFTIKTLVKLTLRVVFCPKPQRLYANQNRGEGEVFLPVLKILILHSRWSICERLFKKMLPGCPILEELSLQYLPKDNQTDLSYPIFSISHKTLKRLTFHCNGSFEKSRLMRFNTPRLVYLNYSGFTPRSLSTADFLDSLVGAKLDVFRDDSLSTIMKWMCEVKTLSMSWASVKEMYSKCVELPFFPNLIKLHFESNTAEGWEVFLRLLNKSPKLENLVLKGLHCVNSRGFCIDRDHEVKVLKICGLRIRRREVRQVKHLLREMKFLEVMKVEIHDDDNNKKMLLMNRLLSEPKRSSKLQIKFL